MRDGHVPSRSTASRHAITAFRRDPLVLDHTPSHDAPPNFSWSIFMNPLNPVAALIKAITFPFHVIFVVGLCYLVNWFTSPGHWWAQWVAFGMGIALLCVWARALKVLVVTVGLAGGAYLVHRWWTGRSARKDDVVSGSY